MGELPVSERAGGIAPGSAGRPQHAGLLVVIAISTKQSCVSISMPKGILGLANAYICTRRSDGGFTLSQRDLEHRYCSAGSVSEALGEIPEPKLVAAICRNHDAFPPNYLDFLPCSQGIGGTIAARSNITPVGLSMLRVENEMAAPVGWTYSTTPATRP